MPIQTACPKCDTSYKLPDEKLGKKVRCKKCQETFTVSSNDTGAGKSSDKIQAKPPKAKPSARRDKDDDDEDDDKGKSKKKKDKDKGKAKGKKGKGKGGSNMMLFMIVGGVLLIGGGVGAWYYLSGESPASNPTTAEPAKPKTKKDGDKKGGKGGKEGTDAPADTSGETSYPSLPDDDPIHIQYKKLLLDRHQFPMEVNSAIEFFTKADPQQERDVHGLLFGFKDHPWRGKISKKLELLVDPLDFAHSRQAWQAYCLWAVPGDYDRLVYHMSGAGEHRSMLLKRIADIRTEKSARFVVDQLTSAEQKLAIQLVEEMGGRLCLKPVFPYLWHPDLPTMNIAARLVKGFDMDLDDALFAEFSVAPDPTRRDAKAVPRVPAPRVALNYDSALKIVSPPPRDPKDKKAADPRSADWRSPERFRLLATLGWLDKQQVSPEYKDKISRALDPLIAAPDYPVSSNALFCLGRWGTEHNLPMLKKFYDSNPQTELKRMTINAMKPVPSAQKTLVGMWPGMDSDVQSKMQEFMLALNNTDARMALLDYFNHKNPLLQKTARDAALNWQTSNDDIIPICVRDATSNNNEMQLSALRWLKDRDPPMDEKRRKDFLSRLEPLTATHPDKNVAAQPAQIALVGEARAVVSRWGGTLRK